MDTGGGLNRGDIADGGRESDGEEDLEGVGGGRGLDGVRGVGQLVVLSGSVGGKAKGVVRGDEVDISGGRGGTGGGRVGEQGDAEGEAERSNAAEPDTSRTTLIASTIVQGAVTIGSRVVRRAKRSVEMRRSQILHGRL